MLNLNSLLLFSENPKKLIEFYQKVFAKDTEWSGGEFAGWKIGAGYLMIGPHSEVHGTSKEPARLIFNFETDDVEGEFERIKEIGAKVIAEPYHPSEAEGMMLATLEDPDGNYFQLATPMK